MESGPLEGATHVRFREKPPAGGFEYLNTTGLDDLATPPFHRLVER